jgi:hypothetical protein
MAESSDSIEFFARYKNWTSAKAMAINEKTGPKDVALFLISVRGEVDRRAFDILGLDLNAIDLYAGKIIGSGQRGSYAEFVAIYKDLGSQEADDAINRASNAREELKPFAKAYLLRSAMEKLGLDHYIKANSKSFGGKAMASRQGEVPFQSEGIVFAAKYGDWVSVKKMSIDAKTKPEEVAAHLSSVRMTIDRKTAEIMGIDTEVLETYAANMMGNMRKSAANLEKITKALSEAEAIRSVEASCKGDQSLTDAAKTYLFSIMLRNLKLDLEVSPDTLMDMFPGLKIPKPKGNFGGKKKKKQGG